MFRPRLINEVHGTLENGLMMKKRVICWRDHVDNGITYAKNINFGHQDFHKNQNKPKVVLHSHWHGSRSS